MSIKPHPTKKAGFLVWKTVIPEVRETLFRVSAL